MWKLAYRNVIFKKTRSILTILGIMTAIQLYVIMSGIMDAFDNDIQEQVSLMAGSVVVKNKAEGINFPPANTVFEEHIARQIHKEYDIDPSHSSAILFQAIVPPLGPGLPPAVLGVGIEPGKESAFIGDIEVDGEHQLTGGTDVIIGVNASEHFGAGIGDSITLRGKTFMVSGILPESNSLIDGSILLPLETAQNLFNRPNLVSAMMLKAAKADEVKSLAEQINANYPDLTGSVSEDLADNAEKILEKMRAFFAMTNYTTIFIAIVVVTIVMVMSIFERKKEIGTLKAIGASRRVIICTILAESLTYCLSGGILALPVSAIINHFMFDAWIMDPERWLETISVSVLVGLLAALWPAWTAQRVNPLESLRYE
ncbi:ABC transporter permease [Pseudalkalibacillus sp. A8]|uniref:ABC transporter permease n=1 Tax=Pseudalkalibacillus sp. A8 TaxID=3382641 RepID=UPI0038B54FAB